ncbi:MAG: SRPBCC family protein [Bacteroidota bacterium]
MILSIIIAAILSFILFGLYQAKKLTHIEITKQVMIDGSQQEVFDMVKYLNNYPKWSPFLEADPEQIHEVKGKDGEVGVQFHWNGNGGKDLGYQEIVKIEEPTYVGVRCNIVKPFKANPTFEYSFSTTSQGTVLTQDFAVESGIGNAFFMWLFGAKKEMASINERGLTLLKNYIER